MAVKPEQLRDTFRKKVNQYEEEIDALLVGHKGTFNGSITLDIPAGLTTDIWQHLRKRYLKAGWEKAEWEYEQREGQWLYFKSIAIG